ncbi:MAG: hypothetical protein ABJA71_04665 [Ginsengibacter sp.]
MKHSLILLFIFISCCIEMKGQLKNKIAGVYSLEGVMETASGFKLNEDSTFEFYYSYGALDRYGSGKWSIKNDSIVLNSKPFPGKDFKITDSVLMKNNSTTIKIKNQNTALYRFVYCFFKTPRGDTLLNADRNGIIILPNKTDTINLLFELSAERVSAFLIDNSKYNSYTFSFEPWAVEVFFKRFALLYSHDHLEGRHPLLEDKKYIYTKTE